jgi:hypothetical protein
VLNGRPSPREEIPASLEITTRPEAVLTPPLPFTLGDSPDSSQGGQSQAGTGVAELDDELLELGAELLDEEEELEEEDDELLELDEEGLLDDELIALKGFGNLT